MQLSSFITYIIVIIIIIIVVVIENIFIQPGINLPDLVYKKVVSGGGGQGGGYLSIIEENDLASGSSLFITYPKCLATCPVNDDDDEISPTG